MRRPHPPVSRPIPSAPHTPPAPPARRVSERLRASWRGVTGISLVIVGAAGWIVAANVDRVMNTADAGGAIIMIAGILMLASTSR